MRAAGRLTLALALTSTLALTLTRCALPANASLYAAARTGPRGRPRCVDAARDRSGPEPCAFELDARVLVVSPLAAAPFNQAANPNPNPTLTLALTLTLTLTLTRRSSRPSPPAPSTAWAAAR